MFASRSFLCLALMVSSTGFCDTIEEVITLKTNAEKAHEAATIRASQPSPSVPVDRQFALTALSRYHQSYRGKVRVESGFILVSNRQPVIQGEWVVKSAFDGGLLITNGKSDRKLLLNEQPEGGSQIVSSTSQSMPPMPNITVR